MFFFFWNSEECHRAKEKQTIPTGAMERVGGGGRKISPNSCGVCIFQRIFPEFLCSSCIMN
jgi:hypothetical protein